MHLKPLLLSASSQGCPGTPIGEAWGGFADGGTKAASGFVFDIHGGTWTRKAEPIDFKSTVFTDFTT
jgi:hypothetical protein